MSYEKIVTLFDNAEHAQIAKKNLLKAGFSDCDISLIDHNQLKAANVSHHYDNIWRRLFGNNLTKEEAKIYTQAIHTGGVILTIRTTGDDTPKAMGILNSHQIVDIPTICHQDNKNTYSSKCKTDMKSRKYSGNESNEEILELAEEQLEVGKKLVKEGSTKVRRFITEKDVELNIPLHEEHTAIFRRCVNKDNPAAMDAIDWSDTVVEMTDSYEKPVINKTAHVVEEVIVRKTGKDHIEKIHEKLRKQEVEVEHKDVDEDKDN
ncbi:MAG: YsnF/AvaK domain-containing protein [Candidatus Dasytiphilus stammeri]